MNYVCFGNDYHEATDALPSYVPPDPEHPNWQPMPDSKCLPPAGTLAKIPLLSKVISTGKGFQVVDDCIGPNNCYPWSFKWLLAGCLLIYVAVHHGFVQCLGNREDRDSD